MTTNGQYYTFDRVVRNIFTMGVMLALIWLLHYLRDVLIPFAVAFLIAYMMNPLVGWIHGKVKNRTAAVFISLFLVIGLTVFCALLILPLVVQEISDMGRILSRLAEDARLAERAAQYLPDNIWQSIRELVTRPEVRGLFKSERLLAIVQAGAGKILPGVWGLLTGAAGLILGLVTLTVIGLYLVFLLMDYEPISKGWKELLPSTYRRPVVEFVEDFEVAMSNYFRGQAAVAAICGILLAIGFSIIGLPLGIVLGIFVGLLNMVPYLQVIGLIPAFLLALFHALETGTGLWVMMGLTCGVFIVVQIIQDVILVPKIMGKVTGLNPAMIMLSLSIWGKLLGFLGLIIALPVTYLLLVYYRRFIAWSVVTGDEEIMS